MQRGLVSALLMAAMVVGCGFEHGAFTPSTSSTPDGSVDARLDGETQATCPDSYVSAYRLVLTTATWMDAELACEADLPGATHLVVLADDNERTAVTLAIQVLPGDVWVGIVRDPGGSAPWPWRYVTGGPATYQPWESSEPNNMSGDQYVAALRQTSGFLYDYGPTQLEYAVCECDN